MKKILLLTMISASLIVLPACRNSGTSGTPDQTATEQPAPAAEPALTYPSLPVERMQQLFNTVDYIDFVFYYANFSMNQSNEASIKATLSQVSAEIPAIDPSCRPIGSLFFQSKGKELMQAELYFSDKCVYYIWLENGKRTYANKMTPEGLRFYQQVFSQAKTPN